MVNAIAEKVFLTSGSMTAAVDRLERKGLLVRKATPADRRAKVLELTPQGRRVVEAAFRRHASELEAATAILSRTEKRQLYDLLKKLGLFVAEAGKKRRNNNDKSSQK